VSELLPIADGPELRTQARLLARRHRTALAGTIALHAAAAGAGLAGPPLLGNLVESVKEGSTRGHVDRIVALLAMFLLAQTILTWLARRASFVLAEKMFAELREDFMRRVLALPLSTDGSQTINYSCGAYDNGFNFMKFCHEQWDALDDQQRREFDPAKRRELLIQQSQIIWQEQPVGVIRFGVARPGYNTRIHNFYPNGYGFLWSLPFIWVE